MRVFLYLLLLVQIALASNEPVMLRISGSQHVAKYSYGLNYHMYVQGYLGGNVLGWSWECKDMSGNSLSSYIAGVNNAREIEICCENQSFVLYATLHYKTFDDEERYAHASMIVTVGEPTFTITSVTSLENGEFDTISSDGNISHAIHFNIDSDWQDYGTIEEIGNGEYENGAPFEDYLLPRKYFLDDDFQTFKISHTPSNMDVSHVHLRLSLPSHIRIYRVAPIFDNNFVQLGNNGFTSIIYCGDGDNLGRIFDRNLFVEGVGIGEGEVKIYYLKDDVREDVQIGSIRYKSCADTVGRQPYCNENPDLSEYLTGCEWSLFDVAIALHCDYNAPAMAVDPNWQCVGSPFRVELTGIGTLNNPFVYDGSYTTSYSAFGGAQGFYTSSMWSVPLIIGSSLAEARVIHYFSYYSAIKSLSQVSPWNMFEMKLNSDPQILHHRGDDLYEYSEMHYSPVIYTEIP